MSGLGLKLILLGALLGVWIPSGLFFWFFHRESTPPTNTTIEVILSIARVLSIGALPFALIGLAILMKSVVRQGHH